ncbi:hypothetical protein GCM10028818_37170 [Spirosoma horti]
MTIELYASPQTPGKPNHPESPVSNLRGELPEAEPTLDFGDLIDTFDSREEAISFIKQRLAARNQVLTETESGSFDPYTHVEWLTVKILTEDKQAQSENYYLVTDEGY